MIRDKAYKYPNLVNFIDSLSSKTSDSSSSSSLSRSNSKMKIQNDFTSSSIFLSSCPQSHQKSNVSSLKWNTENFKIEIVKEQLSPFLIPTLISQLFNTAEFKEVLSALSALEETISIQSLNDSFIEQAICCCFDGLLKLVGLKLMDSNSTVLAKSIDLCEKILIFLDSHQISLDEQEASSFLPFLISSTW